MTNVAVTVASHCHKCTQWECKITKALVLVWYNVQRDIMTYYRECALLWAMLLLPEILIRRCVLSLSNCKFCLNAFTHSGFYLFLLVRASGVREERATVWFCLAFSGGGARVEVEGLKVKLQGRGGGGGSGHTILWPGWLQTTFPSSCFPPSVTVTQPCCTAALPVVQKKEIPATQRDDYSFMTKNVCIMIPVFKSN